MKKILPLFLLFLFATSVAQPLPNYLKTKYQKAKTSQQKAEVLLDIDRPSNADSLKTVQTIQLRDWFKKHNDELGTIYTELYIASIFLYKGDGNISLKMVLPLLKKDGLPEKAREILAKLNVDFYCQYDEKDTIGKRYRRQDAIGTPFCVTVDHQSLEDNTVTIRNRDTMQQERVAIGDLDRIVSEKVDMRNLLRELTGTAMVAKKFNV